MQAVVGVVVFFTLVWFINSKASSIDWEHILSLRIALLGLICIGLTVWGAKAPDTFKKAAKDRWFSYALGFAILTLLTYIYVRPWVGEMQKQAWREQVARERERAAAQAADIDKYKDIDERRVATKSRPVRATRRSDLERILVGPVGYVSYKVTYPSPKNGSPITVVRLRGSENFELPGILPWIEFRPLDTDSVIFIVKQHNPR